MALEALKTEILNCQRCGLAETRHQLIFGEGNSQAPIFIIGEDQKITKVRGTWINCENRLAMPVYHPSALLRNPALKRDTWEDFKKIVHKYRQIVDQAHYSAHI